MSSKLGATENHRVRVVVIARKGDHLGRRPDREVPWHGGSKGRSKHARMTHAVGAEIAAGDRSLAGFRLHETVQVVVMARNPLPCLRPRCWRRWLEKTATSS